MSMLCQIIRLAGWGPSAWLTLLLLRALRRGQLSVTMPGGSVHRFGQPDQNVRNADLTIYKTRALRRFYDEGVHGFCEAYIDGDWTSSSVADLFELFWKNGQGRRVPFLTRLWHMLLTKRIPGGNPYAKGPPGLCNEPNLTNAFFAQWLGPAMTYSTGMFQFPGQSLEDAQKHAYATMVERLHIEPQHRVLEIGCAWGGFTEYVARSIGCRVTAITNSASQYAYTKNRIESAGLADRIDVQMIDWRDVKGQYDRIVCIEKLSKLGEQNWKLFFQILHDRLVPGGRAEIQTGIVDETYFPAYRTARNFIQTHIFPGGRICSRKTITSLIERSGALDLGHITLGADYAKTFHIWQERFTAAWPQIEMMGFDERFKRCWSMFLQYCEAGFRTGIIDAMQISIAKSHASPAPRA